MVPVARRVLGDAHEYTFRMREIYATTLCTANGATLNDFHEAVTTLEETARVARRVLGGANPTTVEIERALRKSRAGLRAREAPSRSA